MSTPKQHGARWLRCDLHVHTPADATKRFGEDWKGAVTAADNGKTDQLARIAQRFVDACRSAADGEGLDLVALTDHNSIEGYRRLRPHFQQIAEQARRTGTSMPAIVPGVELSVGSERSLHVLVIFAADTEPDDIDGAIRRVFGSTAPLDPERATPRATAGSIPEFLNRLYDYCRPASGDRNLRFVVLPAHADGNRGALKETGASQPQPPSLWEEMKGQLRQQVIARRDWHGFQTKKPYAQLPEVFRDLLAQWVAARREQDWSQLEREERDAIRSGAHWPLMEASDPERYEAIGQRFTWLKMEVPDVEGIRLALLDPESRLRRKADGPPGQRYPKIERIRIHETDFFDDVEIPFSPCLSTLIGGRGSGKSTVIEYLRYGLDRDREEDFSARDDRDDVRKAVRELLKTKRQRDHGESPGTLLDGHEVELDVVHAGRTYRVRRSSALPTPTVTADPDSPGATPGKYDVRQLLQPRILSQRQISQIARDPAAQRRELDALLDPARRREFRRRKADIEERISLAQKARERVEQQAASLPARRTELQKLDDDVALLEEGDHKDVFERFQRLQDEKRWLDQLRQELEESAQGLDEHAGSLRERLGRATERAVSGSGGWLPSVASRVGDAARAVAATLTAEAGKLRGLLGELEEEKTSQWADGYEESLRAYRASVAELEAKGVRIDQHQKLLQQRAQLRQEVRALEAIDEEVASAREELRARRGELAGLHAERFAWRQEQARKIEGSGADVCLELSLFGDGDDLEEQRQVWFARTGLRDADWEKLKAYLLAPGGSPFERLGRLASALRADAAATERAGGRPPAAGESALADLMGKELSGHFEAVLRSRERLRLDEMERFAPEDSVKAKVRGRDGSFTPIAQGSLGQRSTAILSLLLSAGEQPLIIDQPEDDLDNQYIYNVVVDLLRKQKFRRQIIVATHNANIPVNGDAELIIALAVKADERVGTVATAGSIDSEEVKQQVSLVMEGSAEAFRLRRQRYNY